MQLAPSAGLLFLVSVLVLAGCESTSQWSPTVDTYGSSRAQYLSSDMEQCRALARSASGDTTEETVRGMGIGAFAGAAGGAILGAMVGSPARGAALGAAAGAAGGGAYSATQTEQQFKQAFSNCMRERGHNVIA
jgi:outer membrane lipoprotein SlyB